MKPITNNFSTEIVEKMKKYMELTKKDKRERGFVLCQSNNKQSIGNKCIGDSCSVDLDSSKCKKGEIRFGTFHTHPKEPKEQKGLKGISNR